MLLAFKELKDVNCHLIFYIRDTGDYGVTRADSNHSVSSYLLIEEIAGGRSWSKSSLV